MKDALNAADGVQQFLDKHRSAKGANAKELRLTMLEADRLVMGLAAMQENYIRLLEKTVELQEALLEGPDGVTVSGGSFR
jgi:hypothetical protein